jgi:uncharacterized lipoprotein YddW (UPF0748 family)
MNKNLLLSLIILCTFVLTVPHVLRAQQAEVRGVWLTTFGGLDWPKSTDPIEQQRSLLQILERLHALHFNTIFFQVRSRGDAFYRSSFEPWARELTGVPGKDPGWDPLAFLLEHAGKYGIEVHAWFNVYKVWGPSPIPFDTRPEHVLARFPEWSRLYQNEWWLDPGIPEVNEHILAVALDLITRYPVEGIHFDHIRYPGRDFDDVGTFALYGNSGDLHSWRRENINRFIRDFYNLAGAVRPDIKIGSAPIGLFRELPGFSGSSAFTDYYQDAEQWLREGIHDYIIPQVYWNIANNPKFDIVISDWAKRTHGRHIYGGIGIFKPEIARESELQVSITRALGLRGQVFFRYGHINSVSGFGNVYYSPVRTPDMGWKSSPADGDDPVPSLLRTVIQRSEAQFFGSFMLSDNKSVTAFIPQRYIVYRASGLPINTNNPSHLLAVLPATTESFNASMLNPVTDRFYYLVSILRDDDNTDHDRTAIRMDLYDRISNILGREILITRILKSGDEMEVRLFTRNGGSMRVVMTDEDNRVMFDLFEGYLDPGLHAMNIHSVQIPAKAYLSVFKGHSEQTRLLILSK